jgi:prepilin-type processing-associated H-X9-DG protein
MNRTTMIAMLAALCSSAVAAVELDPVFVKSWSTSGDAYDPQATGAFFLRNTNALGLQPMTPPAKTVAPPTLPSSSHPNGANFLLSDGSVRLTDGNKPAPLAPLPATVQAPSLNPAGKPGAIVSTPVRR